MAIAPDLFEQITNAIAVLIKNDSDLTTYCIDNLGSEMGSRDNTISHSHHTEPAPFFAVTKGDEEHFLNKATESGLKNTFSCNIVFAGDFSAPQANDNNFVLPAGAEIEVNGIKTYTPTDIMRKIARASAIVMEKKLECQVSQLKIESMKIFSEGYYENELEDGQVGSLLTIELYQKNRGYVD